MSSIECLPKIDSKYKFLNVLGKGKSGTVWHGQRRADDLHVAIKHVQIFDMEIKARKEFMNEADLLRKLNHPNIIRCLEVINVKNDLFLVLEWADSGDIGDMIEKMHRKQRRFSEGDIWRFIHYLSKALHHMHSNKIMHRDIKSANVYVTSRGEIKLGDLGLGKHKSESEAGVATIVGTPLYMSPEIVQGKPYGFKTDIWSLGCLIYELAMLDVPFQAASDSLYLLGQQIIQGEYKPVDAYYSQALRDLIRLMLSCDPNQRPDAHELEQLSHKYLPRRSSSSSSSSSSSTSSSASSPLEDKLSPSVLSPSSPLSPLSPPSPLSRNSSSSLLIPSSRQHPSPTTPGKSPLDYHVSDKMEEDGIGDGEGAGFYAEQKQLPVASELTSTGSSSSDSHIEGESPWPFHEYVDMGIIGKGRFSEVRKARSRKDGQYVAIKRVQIFEMDSKGRKECMNEIQILQSRLPKHRNIIRYIGSFIDTKHNELYLVLELAEEGDFQKFFDQARATQIGKLKGEEDKERAQSPTLGRAKSPTLGMGRAKSPTLGRAKSPTGEEKNGRAPPGFPEAQIWWYFAQICDALRNMHRCRVMHRDIKPSNVFLTDNKQTIKLGDLGLGRYFSSKTQEAFSQVGTPFYMSPETINSKGYDFKSDMWSLGCLLYEFAALQPPFYMKKGNLYTLGVKICSAQYPALSTTYSATLRDLVKSMIQLSPSDRPDINQVYQIAAKISSPSPSPSYISKRAEVDTEMCD